MQQINEHLSVIQPGDQYQGMYDNCLKIYLSGSLNVGESGIPWQQKFINGLTKMTTPNSGAPVDYTKFNFLVINPLSPQTGPVNLENQEFVNKMQWKFQMLQATDVIFVNILKKSVNMSAIEDLLLFAQSGKIVCRCPQESIFYPKISIISQTFGFPLVGDTGSVVTVMDSIFQSIPKFAEQLNFNL